MIWKLAFFISFSLLSVMPARALVVLQYHHISDTTPSSTSTSPALFAKHLDYLKQNNINVISILELKKALNGGKPIADRTAVITFDDAYRSIYDTAFPLLKKHDYPFAVFVNSKPHDEKNPQFASWKQLKEMGKNGAVIANHTDSHPHMIRNLRKLEPEDWDRQRWQEIEFAEKRIEKMTGQSHKLFAYPYGEYDTRLVKMLARKGYLAFTQQSGPVSFDSPRQLIPRFPMGGAYGGLDDFSVKIKSLPLPSVKVVVTDGNGWPLKEPELPQQVDRPELQLSTPLAQFIKGFNCYASGQGAIDTKVHSSTLVARAKKPLSVGRSRYNCTAHAGGGRYYWHSQLFIRRQNNGDWYRE